MKYLSVILFLCSVLFGQIDSVYTSNYIYTGEIIGATLKNIYVMNKTYARKVIPVKFIQRVVLKNGEVVIGTGAPRMAYSAYILGFESTLEAPPDTLETQTIDKVSKANNLDRATKALEDIAFVLKVELALFVAMLALNLIILL